MEQKWQGGANEADSQWCGKVWRLHKPATLLMTRRVHTDLGWIMGADIEESLLVRQQGIYETHRPIRVASGSEIRLI